MFKYCVKHAPTHIKSFVSATLMMATDEVLAMLFPKLGFEGFRYSHAHTNPLFSIQRSTLHSQSSHSQSILSDRALFIIKQARNCYLKDITQGKKFTKKNQYKGAYYSTIILSTDWTLPRTLLCNWMFIWLQWAIVRLSNIQLATPLVHLLRCGK